MRVRRKCIVSHELVTCHVIIFLLYFIFILKDLEYSSKKTSKIKSYKKDHLV